jgi:hypothetical protein
MSNSNGCHSGRRSMPTRAASISIDGTPPTNGGTSSRSDTITKASTSRRTRATVRPGRRLEPAVPIKDSIPCGLPTRHCVFAVRSVALRLPTYPATRRLAR